MGRGDESSGWPHCERRRLTTKGRPAGLRKEIAMGRGGTGQRKKTRETLGGRRAWKEVNPVANFIILVSLM